MGNTVAKITEEIVKITGNEETRAFIGKIVTRKSTDNGIVYVIGSTGYALSTAEYKYFAEAGAIAQSSILPKKIKPAKKSAAKATPKKRPAKVAATRDIEKTPAAAAKVTAKQERVHHAKLSETTPLASAAKSDDRFDAILDDDEGEIIEVRKPEQFEFGSEEHHALLETSDFLMNYPAPSFDLDTPKRFSFFDKKDDFKERATGWFDRIGKKGRDKLIDAMSE